MSALSQLLDKYAEQGDRGLMPAVNEIVQQGYLKNHLYELTRASGSADRAETALAFAHPNGFTKIKLAGPNHHGWVIRVHVWDNEWQDADIHSHRWNFASHILSGEMVEETYELTESPGNWAKFLCSASVQGHYSLTPQGSCTVRLHERQRYHTGLSYERSAATMHKVSTGTTYPIITLFIQGSEQEPATTVIRPASTPLAASAKADLYNAQETRDLLHRVLDQV